MRITLVSDLFYPLIFGGGEKRYWEFARRLAKIHDVRVITSRMGNLPRHEIIEGIDVHRVYSLDQGIYTASGRRKVSTSLGFGAAMLRHKKLFQRSDLIDVNAFPIIHCPAVKFHARFAGRSPMVTTVHEVWRTAWLDYAPLPVAAIGMAFEKFVYSSSDYLLPVSQFTAARLQNRTNTLPAVSNGVDLEIASRIDDTPLDDEIIYTGRLVPGKRVVDLIKAVAIIAKTNKRVHLTIVGDGPERAKLIELTSSLGIKDDVDFLGRLDTHVDVLSAMRRAQVSVLPSIREGQGIVILEAFSVGTPVVAVAHEQSAASHLISHGHNGFLVPAFDAESLAIAIDRILSDHALRHRMSVECSKTAQEYDWDTLSTKLEGVYNDVLSDYRH